MGFHRDTTGRGLHEPASYKVENNTGSVLSKGKVVKRVGYTTVFDVEISTNPVTDDRLGIVLDDIAVGAIGYVGASGDFGQFDSSTFAANAVLYSDASGDLTTTILGDPIATALTSSLTDGHYFLYVPLPIGSGSASGTFTVYTAVITGTDVTNGYITLPLSPGVPTDTVLQYEGAPGQIYGVDFTVAAAVLTFTGLLPLVGAGDSITILFR